MSAFDNGKFFSVAIACHVKGVLRDTMHNQLCRFKRHNLTRAEADALRESFPIDLQRTTVVTTR